VLPAGAKKTLMELLPTLDRCEYIKKKIEQNQTQANQWKVKRDLAHYFIQDIF
jgi:hypothetical protein